MKFLFSVATIAAAADTRTSPATAEAWKARNKNIAQVER